MTDPKQDLVIILVTINWVTRILVIGLADDIHAPTNKIPLQNMFPPHDMFNSVALRGRHMQKRFTKLTSSVQA